MRLAGIIVAAGRGERFSSSVPARVHSDVPKQYWPLCGEPIILIGIRKLVQVLEPEVLVVVARDEDFSGLKELLRAVESRVDLRVVKGGRRRQDSVRHGLEALSSRTDLDRVFVHDAARPILSEKMLKALWKGSLDAGHVIPGVAPTETLKRVSPDGIIRETLPRSEIFRVQTPQFFDFQALLSAHARHAKTEQEFTDDAALMEAEGAVVRVLEGDPRNIKITRHEDLALAEQWLKELEE